MTILNQAAWLALFGATLVPAAAYAQRPLCVTSQAQCRTTAWQAGAPCRCPNSPRTWGTVTLDGDEATDDQGFADQTPERPRRPALRNDDLYDTDDVLAGPRHHRRDND